MKAAIRITVVGVVILGAVSALLFLVTSPELAGSASRKPRPADRTPGRGRPAQEAAKPQESVPLYSAGFVDDSGFDLATSFMPDDYDRRSLEAHRLALQSRSRRGIERFQAQRDEITRSAGGSSREGGAALARLAMLIGLVHMHDGEFEEAVRWIDRARSEGEGLPPSFRANLLALRGVAALRRGELDNCVACVGPSSCIFPLAPEARHQFPSGSRRAVADFLAYLKERPEDVGVRWLLNVAAMTLGEYPDAVPEEYRLGLDRDRSEVSVGRFANAAAEVGLDVLGPNMAGGGASTTSTATAAPTCFSAPATGTAARPCS
ncbi:MAG: tetratricopeptide repeat protein [Isosphaeraceae bacterium]